MHPSLLRIAYALALAAAMAAPAFGQSIVVPNSNATVKGNDTSGPLSGFGTFQDQTVINPDQLPPGPIFITGFAYRATPGKGAVNVTISGNIYLSTSPNWANSTGHPLMSTTFANNVGPDNTLVMSPNNFTMTAPGCAGPSPCPFSNQVVFTTPFRYNRANGPLLIAVQAAAFSASGTGEFDVIGCQNTNCVINNVDAESLGAATGNLEASANITQITYTPAAVELNQHGLTGSWYEAATGGQGIEVEVFANPASGTGSTFVSWFTYDTAIGGADHQRWYTAQGPVVTGQPNAALTIYQNTGGNFNAPPVTNAQAVGNATLSFDTCSSGQLSYTFTDGTSRTGTIPLTRLTQNVTCATSTPYPTNADFALSGNWFGGAATSGQGFTAEVNPNSGAFFAAWYTYMPNGAAAGAAGQRWYTAQGTVTPGLRSIPVTIYETTGGMFDTPTPAGQKTVAVGTGTMTFQSCSAATFNYSFTGGSSNGLTGTIALSRVGPVPPGCTS